jgi:hypothetical protein
MTMTKAAAEEAGLESRVFYDPPFEIWRVLPGNKALDLIDLIIKYDPETPAEVDALGDYLWSHNLIGDLLACDYQDRRTTAETANGLYKSPIDALNAYLKFMEAMHFLWNRANGAQFGVEGAGKRGLAPSYFAKLLSYECATVLLEKRQRYDGSRGWAAIAMINQAQKHWQCAVQDHEGLFRRSIPVDDMHTMRHAVSPIGYELQDNTGEVAMWSSQTEAALFVQLLMPSPLRKKIRIQAQSVRGIYVEMLNPTQRGPRYKSWLTPEPGVMYRPFRYRLYSQLANGQLGSEIPTYLHHEELGAGLGDNAKVALLSANLPAGAESYGILPNGVSGYKPPLNA